jgi:SAM-dependent methyltransferase
MDATGPRQTFFGAVPEIYQRYMVPLFFRDFAIDLAERTARAAPERVLETAAGTGAVTRALAERLPPSASLTATDLAPPMLAQARALGAARPVEWRQADAARLPFPDAAFDAVVCQFGAMFFPDKPKAFAEARRVLRPGGVFLFNVWDSLARNPFPAVVLEALARVFPSDPPRFMERIPHGYFDASAIRADLAAGGFAGEIRIETAAFAARADSAREPALALCQGTPMRNEIEARDPSRLGEATEAAARLLAERFGPGPVEAPMQALVVAARAG